jgi:hypothetical protein
MIRTFWIAVLCWTGLRGGDPKLGLSIEWAQVAEFPRYRGTQRHGVITHDIKRLFAGRPRHGFAVAAAAPPRYRINGRRVSHIRSAGAVVIGRPPSSCASTPMCFSSRLPSATRRIRSLDAPGAKLNEAASADQQTNMAT